MLISRVLLFKYYFGVWFITRVSFWCLFPELHKKALLGVRHESTYIILFLTWYNECTNDGKNDDLHTSSPCLTHSVYVRLMTSQSIHYNDVIMGAIASEITSLTIVYSTVYSDADQRKHQSSASLVFVREFTGDRWIFRTNGQLRGKCFHLMTSSCNWPDNCDAITWKVISNTLDINFIDGIIHGRLCKKRILSI